MSLQNNVTYSAALTLILIISLILLPNSLKALVEGKGMRIVSNPVQRIKFLSQNEANKYGYFGISRALLFVYVFALTIAFLMSASLLFVSIKHT